MAYFLKQPTLYNKLQVLDKNISTKTYIPLSISKENKALSFNINSSKEWENYITNYLKQHNAKVAFGGYLEERAIYNRSNYFKTTKRNIHLGIDFWCAAETAVLALLDGEIHSFKNNINYGDYGPTIILKHQIANVVFYSLYGHLSLNSITNIKVGEKVKKGQKIAQLGTANVNGDYAPHLHFQLIIDIQHYIGDYPGVCSKKELKFYKENCPNPTFLLKLPNEI